MKHYSKAGILIVSAVFVIMLVASNASAAGTAKKCENAVKAAKKDYILWIDKIAKKKMINHINRLYANRISKIKNVSFDELHEAMQNYKDNKSIETKRALKEAAQKTRNEFYKWTRSLTKQGQYAKMASILDAGLQKDNGKILKEVNDGCR